MPSRWEVRLGPPRRKGPCSLILGWIARSDLELTLLIAFFISFLLLFLPPILLCAPAAFTLPPGRICLNAFVQCKRGFGVSRVLRATLVLLIPRQAFYRTSLSLLRYLFLRDALGKLVEFDVCVGLLPGLSLGTLEVISLISRLYVCKYCTYKYSDVSTVPRHA